MADVNKEIAIAITANDQATSVINNTASSAQTAADKMKQTGTQARNAGIAMTGAGVLGLAASNNLSTGARTVEQSYAAVNTMLGAGEDAYDDYHKEVQKLITELPIAGGETEALAGLYQVLSAGIESGADATAVLESAMKASVAGMTSTEVAVDALTSVINAYGLTGEDATAVSDVLFTAVQRGKLTFESLNQAIGPVVAISAQVGVGIEQVAASMATLTKAGLQSDVAGTALKATMSAFLKPSEAMADVIQRNADAWGVMTPELKSAQEGMQEANIELNRLKESETATAAEISAAEKGLAEWGDSVSKAAAESASMMLEANGLQGTLMLLSEATGGSKAQMAELFPNIRALTAVLPLTGEMAEVAAEDLEAMGETAGATGEALEKMANTTEAAYTKLQNRLQLAKDEMGEGTTPAMMGLLEAQVWLYEQTALLNEQTNGLVGGILAVGSAALAIGGPILAIIGQYTLMKAARLQIAAAKAADTAATATNTAATNTNTASIWANTAAMMANPIFLIALVIALVVLALIALYQNWDKVSESVGKFGENLKPVKDSFKAMTGRFNDGRKALKQFGKEGQKNLNEFALSAQESFTATTEAAAAMFESLNSMAQDNLKSFREVLGKFEEMVGGALNRAMGEVLGKMNNLVGKAKKWGGRLMKEFAQGIRDEVDRVYKAIKKMIDEIKDFIGANSPPKRGPLSQIRVWGGNLDTQLAEGMEGNVGRVTRATERVADSAAGAAPVPQGEAARGVGGINITIHARTDDPHRLARLSGQAVADVVGV